MAEILVKEYRGDVVENVHYGSIAIVSSTGETIAYTGDIERQTYMRSASKPIQVLPTLAVTIISMCFRASWKRPV